MELRLNRILVPSEYGPIGAVTKSRGYFGVWGAMVYCGHNDAAGELGRRYVLLALLALLLSIQTGCTTADISEILGLQGTAVRDVPFGTTSVVEEHPIVVWRGDCLVIVYDAEIRTGQLQVSLFNSGGVQTHAEDLVQVALSDSGRSVVTVPVQSGSRYHLQVQPVAFGGAYYVSWRVQ